MKRYSSYSPSGTTWLGNLPSEWECKKIGSLFSQRKEKVSDKDYAPLSVSKGGIVPQLDSAVKTDAGDNRKLVKTGDFVINSRSDRKGSCGISPLDGSVSLINIVLEPRQEWNGRYIHYLMRSHIFSEEYYRYGRGIVSDLWTTRFSEMKNILLPIPSGQEQDKIVRYLDWKVSKINRLIEVKKKELRRICELKKTVVNEAVTHGLNPNVPMKFSGVEWLGNIPVHWTTIKLRQILHPFSEKNHPELPLLSVVREQGVIIRDIEDKESNHNFIPDDLSGYKMVKKGQFAMNKMKAWQGSYGISEYTGIVSPAYFIFDVDFENLEYFHYAIRSKVYVNFFSQASDGIRVGQWDLSINKMKEIPFIVPPADEQQAIVEYIPATFAKYDITIKKLTEEVEVLHELRNKLISDVVTGQIDVRDIEIPEFEYIEETEEVDDDEADAEDEKSFDEEV
ncbi:restriction endonuclease subunit S [Lachnoanaerobaculum gingivalis]|uniref:Restriction endonuclease subunit S n=1 Tax=Lachnoanaerobaculum gingivalis TaxID=2490855 RepID=A0A3P3QZ11_9FIRM|nr:restriction endonuclease subunit S [Lachnoanaerobaculum gingivalis]RRJ25583.1 restriction endonuclease subunit S [Lachnoanaerobaculum gingivalis]